MSVTERWARTNEQIALLHAAQTRGSRCSWCGRDLADGETVYIERFQMGVKRLLGQTLTTHRSIAHAPVSIECASPELLKETKGQTPEPGAHCGRGVFFREARARRQQTICSRRCGNRLALAKRAATLRSRP